MNRLIIYVHIMLVTLIASCSKTIEDKTDLINYINNPENGFIKDIEVGNLSFQMKYLPPEFIALRNLQNETFQKSIYDSLVIKQSSSMTFVLTIGPNENEDEKFDIMYVGISSMEEYQERVHNMNFNFSKYISINDKFPVLCQMENSYSLENKRRIINVFTKSDIDSELKENVIKVKFKDYIFNSGTHVFVFNKDEIENIPQINIL